MNQASSRSRTRPSRRPSRRTRKRALPSLPRLAPRRTRRSISGTAPTRQPRSTTAARHSQPWPRRNRGRFGLAAWLRCTSEPGARAEMRSTTVSSMTTCQTGGSNRVASAASNARQTASHAQRPLQEPVTAGPGARQPGGQDRVGDVAAAGGRGTEQQLGEGGAGAPRHGGGEAADERGQDRRGGGGGRGGHPGGPGGGGGGGAPPIPPPTPG